jgi:hypothetical protein
LRLYREPDRTVTFKYLDWILLVTTTCIVENYSERR